MIDRKIEFPLPDEQDETSYFWDSHGTYELSDDVDLEIFIMARKMSCPGRISRRCVRRRGGCCALRERRMKVTQDDFVEGQGEGALS